MATWHRNVFLIPDPFMFSFMLNSSKQCRQGADYWDTIVLMLPHCYDAFSYTINLAPQQLFCQHNCCWWPGAYFTSYISSKFKRLFHTVTSSLTLVIWHHSHYIVSILVVDSLAQIVLEIPVVNNCEIQAVIAVISLFCDLCLWKCFAIWAVILSIFYSLNVHGCFSFVMRSWTATKHSLTIRQIIFCQTTNVFYMILSHDMKI